MTVMNTVLVEFSNNGNSRTSTVSGHTASMPRLVIEKRKVPEGSQIMAENSVKLVYATTDSNDAPLPNKITFEVIARSPILGKPADVTAALAILKDIIVGDEYARTVSTQNWL